jgi:hypothetical protein
MGRTGVGRGMGLWGYWVGRGVVGERALAFDFGGRAN